MYMWPMQMRTYALMLTPTCVDIDSCTKDYKFMRDADQQCADTRCGSISHSGIVMMGQLKRCSWLDTWKGQMIRETNVVPQN